MDFVDSRREIILALLKTRGHATLGEVAAHLEVSKQAALKHLETLETEGLTAVAHAQSHGRGRPENVYSLTPAAAEHFRGKVDRYSIWNEPNYVGWLSPLSQAPRLYRALYISGYRAIKKADPSAQVLIGETPGMNQPSTRCVQNWFGSSPDNAQNSTRFKFDPGGGTWGTLGAGHAARRLSMI